MKALMRSCLILFLLAPAVLFAQENPRVETFTPQGTVKGVRQVRVKFSDSVVPFGDPRAVVEPFDIDCPEKGTARWADDRNWIYDFERDLPAGIRCAFTVKAGLKTLSGRDFPSPQAFSFSTGGPAIVSSRPAQGAEWIDEEQIFILGLDAEAARDSVLANVFLSVEGLPERIGINVVEGKERDRILRAAGRRYAVKPGEAPKPFLLVQGRTRFPNDTRVNLVWGKGVQSRTGVAGDQDQVLPFKTRKAFSATFKCERENPRAACIPITPMRLEFSASVSADWARKIVLRGPEGKQWSADAEKKDFLYFISFPAPLPENTDFTVHLPPGLKDDAGRPLLNADKFPLAVRTAPYPPLAKFSSRFGILELKADPVLPVTLRNLEPNVKARMFKVEEKALSGNVTGKILNIPPGKGEELQQWLRRVGSASRERSLLAREQGARSFEVPKPEGARAFEVVGIPLNGPGLYVVELESALLGASLLGRPQPMYVPTAVLVTNLSVHFKWGRESSLVWVTSLDKGDPVKGARVAVRDCRERTYFEGNTDENGILKIDAALPPEDKLPKCQASMDSHDYPQARALDLTRGLFIVAQTPEDMSFVHSGWNEGIEPWRFQLPYEDYRGPVIAHTIFDRTLLRAGEKVHMKHLLRRRTMSGFSVPADGKPEVVSIQHVGSNQKYEFPLVWDRGGAAETTWSVPEDANLGQYEVTLLRPSDKNPVSLPSGEFRVEEFRVPLMKGTIHGPSEPQVRPAE
ncbi:MAG TPA: MG2 domain-containing protein, partial [Thermodesulfobacteriota bacterium]|nr:MG2 domain-containing protein [Thermodesulfobacteriota bacterium]